MIQFVEKYASESSLSALTLNVFNEWNLAHF